MQSNENIGGTSGIYIIGGSDYLEHHGVKGQKHGVRRYQNTDGTLTALGRKHYGYGERSVKEVAREAGKKVGKAIAAPFKNHFEKRRIKKAYGEEAYKTLKANGVVGKGKRLSEMSDAEIKKKTERVRTENQLLSELKIKNQTITDIHNAQKSKTTWYSKYGQDLVKHVIDKAFNSSVLAARSRANIEAKRDIIKANIEDRTNREKNKMDAETSREKNKMDAETSRVNKKAELESQSRDNKYRIDEDNKTKRQQNENNYDLNKRKFESEEADRVAARKEKERKRESERHERQLEANNRRNEILARSNPENFITTPEGNVIPLVTAKGTKMHIKGLDKIFDQAVHQRRLSEM